MSARFSHRLALVGLALAMGGVTCDPGLVRVTDRPPDPPLFEAAGRANEDGWSALVADVEEQRGLEFIQRPALEVLEPGDPRLPSLVAAADALAPCPRSTPAVVEAAPGRCFPDPGLQWVLCLPPADPGEARRALGRVLDEQNHPSLVRAARGLRGDPGVALRSLLAASVQREAMAGIAAPAGADPYELLDDAAVEVKAQRTPESLCESAAVSFLALQSDREAPFRNPPLSTKQIVSLRAYRAGEKPLELRGDPPGLADCSVASDESFGVARLLVEQLARGGAVPTAELRAWAGDRLVRFACADGRTPWVYVADVRERSKAASFAARIAPLLATEQGGEIGTATLEQRVVIFAGIDARVAREFAAALRARERSHLDSSVGP